MDRKRGVWPTLYLILIAAAGVLAVLWLTPRGAGVSPDSTVYLESAQSLLSGRGYAVDGVPVTHFPPLYPVMLAAAGLLEKNLVQAARLLNALLFGMNLVLIAWLVYLAAEGRLWVSVLATVFALSAEPILELHAWAWSEPLFIALLLTAVLLLVRYVRLPRLYLLAASALCIGLATITRYVGICLLPAGGTLVYLARPRRDRFQGLRDGAAWLALACLPLAIFGLRNGLVSGAPVDRSMAFHPMALAEFVIGLTSTTSRLIALDPLLARAEAAIVLLILVYVSIPIEAWRMRLRGPERRGEEFAIPFVCLLLCVTYLPFLYVSMAFLDASTPLDARILSPYLILSVVAGFPGLGTLARRLGKPLAWWGFAVAMVILILVRAPAAIAVAQEIRRDGIGYTSRHWTDSATVAYAQALPSGARIYSNAPDILRFLDLRPATQLPAMTNALTLQPNPSYSQMLNAMCEDLASGRAYLVLFDSMNAWNLPDRATLEARCQPRLVQRLTDGTVYGGP